MRESPPPFPAPEPAVLTALFRAGFALDDTGGFGADDLIDLAPLWRAAGRRPGWSPRQWDGRRRRRGFDPAILGEPRNPGPDDHALADPGDALEYALALDPAAAPHLVRWVAERTAGLGPYEQETAVARAQRAFGAVGRN
jgi:hypothetical protein